MKFRSCKLLIENMVFENYLLFYEKKNALHHGGRQDCVFCAIGEPVNNHIYFSDDEELAGDMKDKAKLEDEKTKKEADEKDIKGVPDFWLTIFKVIIPLYFNSVTYENQNLKFL